jgi:hypothetical protein
LALIEIVAGATNVAPFVGDVTLTVGALLGGADQVGVPIVIRAGTSMAPTRIRMFLPADCNAMRPTIAR